MKDTGHKRKGNLIVFCFFGFFAGLLRNATCSKEEGNLRM